MTVLLRLRLVLGNVKLCRFRFCRLSGRLLVRVRLLLMVLIWFDLLFLVSVVSWALLILLLLRRSGLSWLWECFDECSCYFVVL